MIRQFDFDGLFVLDAVTHAYNHTPENWADEAGGHSMVEMAYALARNSPDVRHEPGRPHEGAPR